MGLRAVSPIAECSHHVFQAFVTSSPHSKLDGPVSLAILSNPFLSTPFLKSHSSNKVWRNRSVRRSCSANLDNLYGDEPSFRGGGDHGKEGHRKIKKLHYTVYSNRPFLPDREQYSFPNTRFDFLEPMMLGIRPEFPYRPDHETIMWASIEQKAKSLDIPLSLRMIKKKLQCEEGSADSTYCSVKAAFSSMVFMIVELQSCALQMMETLCDEDLESVTSNVQKDMHSSFVWLFQQVFSRTPDLMLHVMLLLADFGVHSVSRNIGIVERQIQPCPQTNLSLVKENGFEGVSDVQTSSPHLSEYYLSTHLTAELGSNVEVTLWDSMVDEARIMRDESVIDHDILRYFVSPVSVKLEPDGYEDYLRTDLLYQMNLSMEPNNSLLLCNYAQYLYLVERDYDRAEECFKRAVQLMPPDAESLTQYASFLWTVRKDYLGAEERFLHALAIEPGNSYYASRYANFLWSTGGEETCFPLNTTQNPNA